MSTRPRAPKGARPQLLHSPHEDRLLAMVLTLATELAAVRERCEAIERAARSGGLPVDAMLADTSPQTEEDKRRWRAEFSARLLRILEEDLLEPDPAARAAAYQQFMDTLK